MAANGLHSDSQAGSANDTTSAAALNDSPVKIARGLVGARLTYDSRDLAQHVPHALIVGDMFVPGLRRQESKMINLVHRSPARSSFLSFFRARWACTLTIV